MKLLIMRKGFGVFLVFGFIIFSCSTKDQVIPDFGLEYYPLQVDNYSIYQVDETHIVQSIETKTSYELKVTITDSSINQQGVVTYILVREKRASASDNWVSLDTWSAKVVNNSVIQNEGNVLFVKLVFPPALNVAWDGNQYNNLKVDENPFNVNLPYDGNILTDNNSDQYVISEQQESITLPSGFEAANALTVTHNNFQDNIVGTDQRKEVYAKDVGLIYKEINQYINCNGSICNGDKAGVLIQSLKEHGKI